MAKDPRDAAARYRAQLAGEEVAPEPAADPKPLTPSERHGIVEQAIQQAMRAGAFDNLPGAGKPIEGLGEHHDPDWWIKQQIRSEDLHGLGPAALTLRVEDRQFADRMDELRREQDVREAVADFNARVKHARMQLLGGPPVVTQLRDADAEVAAWNARRAARETAALAHPSPHTESATPARRRWFRRAR